jgi:hypothetical protein
VNKLQISRARSFIKRLIRVCYQHRTPERRAKLLNEATGFFYYNDVKPYESWDQKNHICDYFRERFDDQYCQYRRYRVGRRREEYEEDRNNRFLNDLSCIVRLAINVVCPEQDVCGVIGFTPGELRQMYPRGLPTWLDTAYGTEEGGYRKLSELPDDAVLAV